MKAIYRIGKSMLVMAGLLALLPVMSAAQPLWQAPNYYVNPLVSDLPGAMFTDGNLVNPWGIAVGLEGHVWIADNGMGLITMYDRWGAPDPLVISVPPPLGGTGSAPTGMIQNMTNDFKVSEAGRTRPSSLIVATEDGTISGWNKFVDKTNAILEADNSEGGAVYKGIAQGHNKNGNFLYATDFHNGVIAMFDSTFAQVGTFYDPAFPPSTTPTYAPFGIENINGMLFVTYALQKDAEKKDDQAGVGNGFVDIFDTMGNFVSRFASNGTLNSPWGLQALSFKEPIGFLRNLPFWLLPLHDVNRILLVGNFGDGMINAFDIATGAFLGQLQDCKGNLISIPGLWGLEIGDANGLAAGQFYFTAGINDEADGLFGRLVQCSRFTNMVVVD